jgi:hypothetical protein
VGNKVGGSSAEQESISGVAYCQLFAFALFTDLQ